MEQSSPAYKVAALLIADAAKAGKDIQIYFQEWLDWLIGLFSIENLMKYDNDYNRLLSGTSMDNRIFVDAFYLWLQTVNEAQRRHKCVDFFGDVYEKCFQSNGKAARLQQYFTPSSISSLSSRCMAEDKETSGPIRFGEPSCGSGRNILALWQDADWNRTPFVYAEDLDPVSVKMCALNLMINGMIGHVICHNTLLPENFIFGYTVNEVRHPLPTNFFSIRKISAEEYHRLNATQKNSFHGPEK